MTRTGRLYDTLENTVDVPGVKSEIADLLAMEELKAIKQKEQTA